MQQNLIIGAAKVGRSAIGIRSRSDASESEMLQNEVAFKVERACASE